MFGNVSKFLMGIVSLVITLSIVGMTMGLYYVYRPAYDTVREHSIQQVRLTEQAQYSPYNNTIVSGSQIITAMRRYSEKEGFYIYVDNISQGRERFIANPFEGSTTCLSVDYSTGELTSTFTSTCTVLVDDMTDESSQYYIQPQDRYRSKILEDLNGRTAGILFVLQ